MGNPGGSGSTAEAGGTERGTPRAESRSAGKRRTIMAAATALFLRQGYQGTSMDEIAAVAAVSKQTVYQHFRDKAQLFVAIVESITGRAEEIVTGLGRLLEETDDVEAVLTEVARRYITSVVRPEVLQLRRLVTAEAGRFPELARAYFERAPGRGLTALAAGLAHLAGRDLLTVADADLAANHFAYLVLGFAVDRAVLCGDETFSVDQLHRLADAGVGVFLRAYGPRRA